MRILYWLLGAAGVAAATVYVVNRGKQDRIAQDFLLALRQGPIEIREKASAIVAPGQRAIVFKGEVGGRPFDFRAEAAASNTRWIFILEWAGVGRFAQTWNPMRGEREQPMQTAYLILLRHATASRGAPN